MLPKIVVIVGATSVGKTTMGLALAKDFNGEIISADSRQVYKKMDVGTAKPAGEWGILHGENAPPGPVFLVDDIPHYMMDIVDPGHEMTLAEYKNKVHELIQDITSRGKLPIIVGGTGLYIWSVVDNLSMPPIAPNKTLRRSLEKRSPAELVNWLQHVDPKSFAVIDTKNPRRVIRALEVAILTGESFTEQKKQAEPLYEVLQIGLQRDLPEIYQRIDHSIDEQMRRGLVEETNSLLKQKYGWVLPSMSSIGYKQIGDFIESRITEAEAVTQIKAATHRYAKRQLTWFKRDKRIKWLPADAIKEARQLIKDWLA